MRAEWSASSAFARKVIRPCRMTAGAWDREAAALYETLPSSFHASLAGISPATYF